MVVAVGLANFAIGVPQVLNTGQHWLLYPENPMPDVLFGTFANRNSAGVFLVAALTLLIHLPALGKITASSLARTLMGAVLLLAIILTQSRTAIGLAFIPLASVLLRWGPDYWQQPRAFKMRFGVGLALAAFAIAAMAAFAGGSRLQTSLERFDAGNQARTYIWDDATFSAQKYWPAGSGMGTFDEVFQADESLENLTAKKAGRAHNDYLELAIEAGAFGVFLVVAWVLAGVLAVWRSRQSQQPWLCWSGGPILLVFACQSVFDYPARNQTLLVLGALAIAMLFRASQAENENTK
jgi:O-antigen ligase